MVEIFSTDESKYPVKESIDRLLSQGYMVILDRHTGEQINPSMEDIFHIRYREIPIDIDYYDEDCDEDEEEYGFSLT